jgi:hypothetical protein
MLCLFGPHPTKDEIFITSRNLLFFYKKQARYGNDADMEGSASSLQGRVDLRLFVVACGKGLVYEGGGLSTLSGVNGNEYPWLSRSSCDAPMRTARSS